MHEMKICLRGIRSLAAALSATCLLPGCFSQAHDGAEVLARRIAEDHKVLSVEDWHGGRRIEFDFNGYNAWLVAPPKGTPVAEGRPWTWTMQWREAFVDRTGASEMLRRGWHHAAIDTYMHRMDSTGLEVNRAFQRYLVERLGLKARASLIGMSWGGFFSVRYAATYADCVDRIYLDAPLLTFHGHRGDLAPDTWAERVCGGSEWRSGPQGKSWESDPRMPVNMVAPIAEARIPVLLLYGGQDQSVKPGLNAELFSARMRAAHGVLHVGVNDAEGRGRALFGHHPHGLEIDQQGKLAEFFEHGIPGK